MRARIEGRRDTPSPAPSRRRSRAARSRRENRERPRRSRRETRSFRPARCGECSIASVGRRDRRDDSAGRARSGSRSRSCRQSAAASSTPYSSPSSSIKRARAAPPRVDRRHVEHREIHRDPAEQGDALPADAARSAMAQRTQPAIGVADRDGRQAPRRVHDVRGTVANRLTRCQRRGFAGFFALRRTI